MCLDRVWWRGSKASCKPQDIQVSLSALAMMGHMPGEGFLASLEKRLERVAWNFTPSEIANVLWAYATLGVMPSAGVVGLLEGQLRAVAGQLNHQDIFMTLWAACFLSR